MTARRMRALAICVFRNEGRILVAEGHDHSRGITFYRPLGGTIEFGEYSIDAVRREIREELSAAVTDLRFLGTLENIFTYNGRQGHEIVQVYDGRFVDESLYKKDEMTGDEFGHAFRVVWRRLDEFGPGRAPLFPDGLLELLSAQAA